MGSRIRRALSRATLAAVGAASGPPQLVVYFATVLAAVAVFMFNVDRLVAARMREAT
ncbi:hypothetical protein PM035_17335 [Halorubrum ezzemoulense]|uniref:hypothetical protein n=1 Tax=Halorubrum ezzemoulense TaxID=337243 RepID=UPI00232EF77D|nr:hypothetical protein [Halorubrum ezzemoulense]MDB2269400.1 hypothetical protein [Halorubrum ezzemoulense]